MRPYNRYSYRFDGDGRTTVRPYTGLLVTCVRTYSYTSVSLHGEQTTACGRTNHSPQSEELCGVMMVTTAYTERSPPSVFALDGGRLLFSFKCVATVCDGYMLEGAERS